jgi:hypothetical protein
MLALEGIYTNRDTPQPSYWDIVHEWEDEFSRVLNVPLMAIGNAYANIYRPSVARKVVNRVNGYQLTDRFFFHPRQYRVAFHIGPPSVYSFHSRKNVIPILIDFWKHEDLRRFERIFKLSEVVAITSRQAFCYLTSQGINLPIRHVALSLPDKYLHTSLREKDIDMIQVGRRNQKMEEFVMKFLEKHPQTHYVCAQRQGDVYRMVSNKFGDMGIFTTRADFMELLKRSKISLVAAPGMDVDSIRTGGFAPLTPRFLESAACRCRLIAMYPDNEDFRWYNITEVAAPVGDYESFLRLAEEYIDERTAPDYSAFLKKHVTSLRAQQLSTVLQGGD